MTGDWSHLSWLNTLLVIVLRDLFWFTDHAPSREYQRVVTMDFGLFAVLHTVEKFWPWLLFEVKKSCKNPLDDQNETIFETMASIIASPGQEFPKKLPALPLIEHPALRKSEDNNTAGLQIRGSSREESKAVLEELDDALPPLKRRIKQKALHRHSRVLTWPLGKH